MSSCVVADRSLSVLCRSPLCEHHPIYVSILCLWCKDSGSCVLGNIFIHFCWICDLELELLGHKSTSF